MNPDQPITPQPTEPVGFTPPQPQAVPPVAPAPPTMSGMLPPPPPVTPMAPPAMPGMQTPMPMAPVPASAVSGGGSGVVKKILLIVGIIFIGFLVLAIIGANLQKGGAAEAQKVSDEFLADVRNNNNEAAYALGSTEFKEVVTQDQVDDFASQLKNSCPTQPPINDQDTATGSTAKTKGRLVSIVYRCNDQAYVRFVMQEIDGKWQIISFHGDSSKLEPTFGV